MRPSVATVARLVAAIVPGDDQEAQDIRATLGWFHETDDVFRRVKPAVPDRHLVSYVVPVDPASGGVLLGEHRNAGLWLPPGGHVEADEHPAVTARREAAEELGVDPGGGLDECPAFLSITVTVGLDAGHTDVGLWFVAGMGADERMRFDPAEFRSMRWWAREEIGATEPSRFDPAFGRFLRKLSGPPG